MSPRDLSTSAGVLDFARARRQEMANCFRRLGRFDSNGYSFEAYVFATHALRTPSDPGDLSAWRTGKKLDRVAPLMCRMPREAHLFVGPADATALMGQAIRHYARLTRAVGVLFMTEMWRVHQEKRESQTSEQARAELPRNLEHAPGRTEELAMWVEHSATGHRYWHADIKREPTRLEQWQEQSGYTPDRGRLVNLVDWRS
ncbi:MAG: hypothetical protein RL685_1567 [Pseudomonadota bacterium]|jgi:hypothetical protein